MSKGFVFFELIDLCVNRILLVFLQVKTTFLQRMKTKYLIVLFFALSTVVQATTYMTQSHHVDIKSLVITVDGDQLAQPVVELNSKQQLQFSFDLMSYEMKMLDYKIVHCNSDWTPSDISSMEYIDGFDNGTIDDYEYSINTTANYINYWITFPNENTSFTKSGNYALIVAEDYNYDNPLATFCFSITEDIVIVKARSSGNTLREINRKFQQLEIELDYTSLQTSNPPSEFTLVIEQNNRRDNARIITQPTYTQVNKLIYRDSQNLIFEGGNSFRSIDFSSEYTYGAGIERIEAKNNIFHVILSDAILRSAKGADLSPHAYGRYVINRQESDYDHTESDYMWVHFWLPMDPLLNGGMYVIGDLTRNHKDAQIPMSYDFENHGYFTELYLKQGGYNFLYGFLPKGGTEFSLQPVEGSFWQTENNYVVKVYHRPFGQRYDRLVAVITI